MSKPLQPIMSRKEARQFLAELKSAYKSLRASDRAAVSTTLEQVAATNTLASCEATNTTASFYLAEPISHLVSAIF
jgi:hypothetical protein